MNTKHLDLYVVDDDAAVRDSLAQTLALRGNRFQTFESGEAFLECADLIRGGFVVLDLRMDPGMSGLQVFDELLRRDSPLVVLFLSGHGTIALVEDAVKRGAFGWAEKRFSDDLMQKIERALQAAEAVAARHRSRRAACLAWDTLTPAEKRVAYVGRDGRSSKVEARVLDLGFRTVQGYRAKIYAKLGVTNATELDRFIRDNGL